MICRNSDAPDRARAVPAVYAHRCMHTVHCTSTVQSDGVQVDCTRRRISTLVISTPALAGGVFKFRAFNLASTSTPLTTHGAVTSRSHKTGRWGGVRSFKIRQHVRKYLCNANVTLPNFSDSVTTALQSKRYPDVRPTRRFGLRPAFC